MLQNPCKTVGFMKIMVYKIPPGGGEVNHIQPVAYLFCLFLSGCFTQVLLYKVSKRSIVKDVETRY